MKDNKVPVAVRLDPALFKKVKALQTYFKLQGMNLSYNSIISLCIKKFQYPADIKNEE